MIEIRNLKVSYGKREALSIPSLSFPAGKISAVLGENGSGKSTLLKSLVGLLPYAGEILAEGEELRSLSQKERAKRISFLPQNLSVPEMDAYTLASHGRFSRLGFSKTLSEKDREMIEKAMRLTGTWEYREKKLRRLSGGERQSVYLAMAIAQDTKILLLDEPDTYLDVSHQLKINAVLRTLADSGKTVITVSHDIAKSFAQSDHILILQNGKALLSGPPEVLSEDPALRQALGAGVKKTEEHTLYGYVLTGE